MSRKNDLVRSWMPKEFRKKVKIEAVRKEKSMAQYMRDLARGEDTLDLVSDDDKARAGRGIDFGF